MLVFQQRAGRQCEPDTLPRARPSRQGTDWRPALPRHRFKAVGISLAIASGLFIGVSFVLKKKGLLAANIKDGKEAGEGYGYLRNGWWWTGMILSKGRPV